jgi:hypothetical protein
MAWKTTKPKGPASKVCVATETYTLPASATTEYSTEIDFLEPNLANNNFYVAFSFNASAVSGTNLDIALYGASESGGTKVQLLDAVVADITATGRATGVVDLNAYPAAYYYLGWTSDADESANTIEVEIEFVSHENF